MLKVNNWIKYKSEVQLKFLILWNFIEDLQRVKKYIYKRQSSNYVEFGNNTITAYENGLTTVINHSGVFVSDSKTNALIKSITPGQIISFNGTITVTNSSGIYVGDSMINLKMVSKDTTLTHMGTINIVSGIISVTNSSGVYAGRSYDNLVKL